MIKIFLAEDNPGDVFLVKRALQEYHITHELYVVNDGAEAIDYLSKMGSAGNPPCPDLFLLDLNLPKIDGPDVLREFRKHASCGLTPVIVVTSSDAQRDKNKLLDLGVTDYFRKPTDLKEYMRLGDIVRRVAGDKAN